MVIPEIKYRTRFVGFAGELIHAQFYTTLDETLIDMRIQEWRPWKKAIVERRRQIAFTNKFEWETTHVFYHTKCY